MVGIIIAAVTQGAIFDVTGGLLTAVGLIFAGITTMVKKNKIVSNFSLEIKNGKDKLENEVNTQLKNYIGHLRKRIEDNFNRFDSMLITEEKQIGEIDGKYEELNAKLTVTDEELVRMLKNR